MEDKPKKIRYIHELLPEEQKWLAKAVISIFLADNRLEDKHILFMKGLSKVFLNEEPKETINQITKALRTREIPEIGPFNVENPEHLIFMLNTLVTSIFANDNKTEAEVKNYFKAGLKLGVTYEVLMLKLTYQKDRFRIKMAQKEVDETIRQIVQQRKVKEEKCT